MGPKNRNLPPRSKLSRLSDTAGTGAPPNQEQSTTDYASIKDECRRAMAPPLPQQPRQSPKAHQGDLPPPPKLRPRTPLPRPRPPPSRSPNQMNSMPIKNILQLQNESGQLGNHDDERGSFKDGLVEKAFLEALDFAHKNRTWRFWPCVHCDNKFVDWELQLRHIEEEHKEEDRFSCQVPEKDSENRILDDIGKSEGSVLPNACSQNQSWTVSDDIERAEILEQIHGQFQLLLRHEFLSMLQFSKRQCIVDLSTVPDYVSSSIDARDDFKGDEIDKRIVLIGDPSCLLDEHFLLVEFMAHRYHDAEATCTVFDDEVDALPDSDAFIDWLFHDPSSTIGEELSSWTCQQGDIKRQVLGFFQTFEEELRFYWDLNKVRLILFHQKQEFNKIEGICNEELEKRENDTNHVPQSYVSLLKRLQEQLAGADYNATGSRKHLLDAVLHILEEVQALDDNLIKIEKASDHMDEEYVCIRIAILRQTEHLSLQAKMEASVNEDAKRKSDAAAEMILSESALDAKKNTGKGGNNPTKHPKRNSKDKKKKEDKRKAKDPKSNCDDELIEPKEIIERSPFSAIHSMASSCHFPVVSAYELNLQEEELKRKIEIEEEERKLEEMLERQRLIEDEMNNLAKQTKNEAELKLCGECATVRLNLEAGTATSSSEMLQQGPSLCKNTLQAQKNLPLTTSQSVPLEEEEEEEEDLRVLSTDITFGSLSGSDTRGPGLRSDSGEYDCFLNAIIQGQVNDASEVLEVIFGCLHQSCISGFGVSDTESSTACDLALAIVIVMLVQHIKFLD
ncbi:ubiquitin carboxyl-terminal hydrolase-related protein [Actinidia rufa]|uniref:Ubiquitin carboxyl-terminal hydrolase-related protein n=1 Tax=Actinidia rufa TaxID=165716 RepID=A0A7J0H8P7_9ERIC|nr:ubiquitin carboxyl-terminal hydrolase-related protein [Actinidia rufa]